MQALWSLSLSLTFVLAGKQVGGNEYHAMADGSFESISSLSLGPSQISSKLTGIYRDGTLIQFHLVEGSGKNMGDITFKDGKFTVVANGKSVFKDKVVPLSKVFFSTYHHQVLRTLLAATEKNSASPKFKILDISSLTIVESDVSRTNATIELPKGNQAITNLRMSIKGIELDYAFDVKGAAVGFKVPAQSFTAVAPGYDNVFVDPLSKYPELSQPTHKTAMDSRQMATMRDGVKLMADVLRPAEPGKYPVILIRTPYGRAASLLTSEWLATRGYVVVSQDTRGRGGSGGTFDPFNTEIADGKDTLDWVAAQPWCDGNVGMIGGSYLGMVQWAAAVTHHPLLKCIIPQVSPPEPTRNVPWDNGSFLLTGNIWWSRIVKDRDANMAMAMAPVSNLKGLRAMPMTQVDNKVLGVNVPFFDIWLHRPNRADWPGAYTTEQVAQVKIPVMHVSGMWDGDGIGTLLHWNALRAAGGNQWLVFGPWEHGFNLKTKFGDQDYGPTSVMDLDSMYLRFFDTYLKGASAKLDAQPRVRMFVTGSNKWIETSDWPSPDSKAVTLYFGGGKANGKTSAGTLLAKPKSGKDSYRYDPNSVDFKKDEISMDTSVAKLAQPKKLMDQGTLLYSTAPLTKATTFAGPLRADLWVATTAKDATFNVMVFDESPNGEMLIVGHPGTRRITWDGVKISSIKPNTPVHITLEPWLFARQFAKGHRLTVAVRSDMFPGYARNPGTGEPDWKATKLIAATQTVFKDVKHPSHITLYELP